MAAEKYDITIEKGASFDLDLIWQDEAGTPIDLTSYTAALQIRETAFSGKTLLDLDSGANGGITLAGVAGTISISIPAAITETLQIVGAVYDLLLTAGNGGKSYRIVEGTVTISPDVTR